MQRVIEAAYVIGPGYPAPEYDPSYVCPLNVEQEHFIDHTIEVEISKSFPGLLTMYHLYTVEIICSGLPGVDFNTLEYAEPGKDGERKLKYIHAWSWLEWRASMSAPELVSLSTRVPIRARAHAAPGAGTGVRCGLLTEGVHGHGHALAQKCVVAARRA
ncbi:unnamed protein product [Prorocentrum cordatum]|uniref:Transmembrane 9 superfamily member n=1 Tax=Prorocentrum cordatum TaxID=2364126 RepID=A0ABN9WPK9_9DINO|nr:unnamed protein product [Polarella glacialis]